MKPFISKRRKNALTLIELLVILAVIAVLAAMLLPATTHNRPYGLYCINNLRQIGIAYKVWADDNNGKYPMAVTVTNGGTLESCATGNVIDTFQIMSNELSTPVVLICLLDKESVRATNFGPVFTKKNISYFVGVDADPSNPQSVLSGDDNLQVGGIPLKSGLSTLTTNSDMAWTSSRHAVMKEYFWMPDPHKYIGNIGFADGSVSSLDTPALQKALQQTGTNTIRLAIP